MGWLGIVSRVEARSKLIIDPCSPAEAASSSTHSQDAEHLVGILVSRSLGIGWDE